MKIKLHDLIELQQLSLKEQVEIGIFTEDEGILELFADINAQYVSGYVIVNGLLYVTAQKICDRCLEVFNKKHEIVFEHEYDIDLENEDFLMLDEDFRQAVLMEFPLRNICNENCRGLCTSCGNNLNKQQCDCKQKLANPAFEILKTLKKPKNEK